MSAKPPARRVRRSPEEAHALILAAATRVLAEQGPSAAGLKEIARAAGVSHALVSHYFGTFDALVEAVFEAYISELRARLLARFAGLQGDVLADTDRIVDEVFAAIASQRHARIAVWLLLSGRFERDDFFPLRQRGLALIVDALLVAGARSEPPRLVSRDVLESAVVLVVASTFGYLLGGSVFWGALGHARDDARDAAFRRALAASVRAQLGPG